MFCIRCKREIPEGSNFCNFCGKKQVTTTRKKRKRANGLGTARKRGDTWTAISPPHKEWVNGAIVTRRITQGGFATETDALLAAATLLQHDKPVKPITWLELYEKWLDRHKGRVTKGTLGCYTAAKNYFTDLYCEEFIRLVTEDWQGCIDDCSAGKRTRQNMKALGTQMYRFAMEQDITEKNFAQFIYIENTGQSVRNAFSREDLQTILDGAHNGVPYANYVACGCYLGFRPSELFSLKKSDYDSEERILIGGMKTEAGRNRIVPVHPIIQPFIDRLLKTDSEFIFPNASGGQFTQDNFRKDYFYKCMADL